MKVLVTGAAGFIGYHVCQRLISRGDTVVGIDSINNYYSTELKYGRLKELGILEEEIQDGSSHQSSAKDNFTFVRVKLEEYEAMHKVFEAGEFDTVIHLAAQAGVRYSLDNPKAYVDSNIVGFVNVLELSREFKIKHLTYASSSSVYGLNESMPFSTMDNVDHPISLYAASKKSNELMAHSYSHLFDLPTTGLRFFTVYGPWGRPDMAYFLFTKAILENKPIKVFNNGNMSRDFTYIDDIVEGVVQVNDRAAVGNKEWSGQNPDPSTSKAPFRLYNIGNNAPVKLMDFVSTIENCLGKKAQKEMMAIQPGDVESTYADVSDLISDLNYKPNTDLEYGINQFIDWYKVFYKVE
jgi:UDP-glucuronate 4-epimerase